MGAMAKRPYSNSGRVARRKPARKPTTIKLEGDGFCINAEFSGGKSGAFGKALTDFIQKASFKLTPTDAAGNPTPNEHDFDTVLRVIEHGNVNVLQSIIRLATDRLQPRDDVEPPQSA